MAECSLQNNWFAYEIIVNIKRTGQSYQVYKQSIHRGNIFCVCEVIVSSKILVTT